MSDRLPWFRCFPSALLGALAGLDPDEGLTYVTALLRIYETGGPVAETGKTLSRRTGLTERRAAAALDRLIGAGKLVRTADGRLDSATTHDEIRWQTERRGDQSSAGKASAAKRQQQASAEKNPPSASQDKANGDQKTQRNQHDEANARSTDDQRSLNHLEEEKEPKKQGSDAGASGSSDEPNVPLSPKDLLWRDGVLTLRGLGMADPAARRLIGKLLRDTGGDSGRVHWAIDEAKRAGTGDPIPLVTRILNDTPTNARAGPARFEGRDSAATVLLKRDAEARRNEQPPHEPDFFDDRTGRFESRGRSPRDEAPQRDRMGGAGQVLDLVAVGSHRR